MKNPGRVALVHDWLVRMRGGEKCLEVLCELFPEAEIFTLVHERGSVSPAIERHAIHTSFLQNFPGAKEHYPYYLPLFPAAIGSFRLKDFELVVSVSASVAKSVRTPGRSLHICYCNTPMRYIWDQFDEYFGPGRSTPLRRAGMALVRRPLQRWDVRTASRPSYFIANSENVRGRIQRIYGRSSEVIYPPVETDRFTLSSRDDGYYLVVSALVPYKRVDLAIEALKRTGERLIVVGDGEELERLRARAGPEVKFTGWRSNEEIAEYYRGCRAVLFPGEEDFGIVPLEAMASGKPVVAFARGGALETVLERADLRTGVLFSEQSVSSLEGALRKVREMEFDPLQLREFALGFDRKIYRARMKAYLEERWSRFAGRVSQVSI